MWGYSGGAIATVFAAELATQYATELSFAGAAIGGVVPNMTVVIHNINSSPFTGNIPAGLVGVTNQYEDASAFLLSSLKESGPYNRTGFFKVKEYTILESWAAFAGQDIFEYFVNGIGVMYAPVMLKVLRSNTVMGYHGTPQMPMFVHQGVRDKFSDISLTDALVERYCGIGVRVRYERNSVGGHIAEITNGPPRVQAWLAGVLEGTGEVEEGCDVRNVTVAIVDVPDF
ncbi:lipase [Podospora aff. communis PSN243]|uniref:Lipase n=1 Tax=Podospora aff. communis PSN243 TaxID=3040156 RepID=A0AAV9GGT7_9PEZI|nr:lipase [Podospora aff. communis PSN243]